MKPNGSSAAAGAAPGTPAHPFGLRTVMELFDVGPGVAIAALSGAAAVVLFSVFYFIRSAPPTSLTITSGPPGSIFQRNADKYAKLLEEHGVQVRVLTSKGSLENLQRLADPKSGVDVGIVQGGLIPPLDAGKDLVSLGSISYQPMLIFYRGKPIELLSELAGKRIAIGAVGSGSRDLALKLLNANGIKEGGSTTLLDWDAERSDEPLLKGQIDAAFVMSEAASLDILRKLLRAPGIHLYNFKQATAYARKIEGLNKLDLPRGAVDFGLDIPPHDVELVGPMVELIASRRLHPALSDLLLEAAVQVHSRPGVFQKRGDFPTPVEHAIRISEDATRYYRSGKTLLYRFLPFWLASLLSRIIVVFVPMLVVLVPALKSIPAFFHWRTRIKIRRRYRELLALEQELLIDQRPAEQERMREHFDRIDEAVHRMRIPAAHADQLYGLRGHIDYVRQLVAKR